jgi:hypothetical protein
MFRFDIFIFAYTVFVTIQFIFIDFLFGFSFFCFLNNGRIREKYSKEKKLKQNYELLIISCVADEFSFILFNTHI